MTTWKIVGTLHGRNTMSNQINIKDYKLKRPKEGYNSEKEREFSAWSGISDWELFYNNQKIGTIYYVGSNLTEWAGYLETKNCKHTAFPSVTRKEVFEQLANAHHKSLVE